METHIIRRLLVLGLGALAVMTTGSSAQTRPLVPVNDTVRVWASALSLKGDDGIITEWRDSTVLFSILGSEGGEIVPAPFPLVTRLDVLRERSTAAGAWRGGTIGGGVGVLLGMLIGTAAVNNCVGSFCELEALSFMGGGMLIGIGFGALIGADNPGKRWERVDLPTAAGFPPTERPSFVKKLLPYLPSLAMMMIYMAR